MTTPSNSAAAALSHVEELTSWLFGSDVLPVREFDDVQAELDFLEGGSVFATARNCPVCGNTHAPFIVSATVESNGRLWRGSCLDCWGQVRVPVTIDEATNQWQLHEDEADVVVLDTVPTYHEQTVDTETEASAAAGEEKDV